MDYVLFSDGERIVKGSVMWADIKFYCMWGLIWVCEKLRIITHEAAENARAALWLFTLSDAALERERDRKRWGFTVRA